MALESIISGILISLVGISLIFLQAALAYEDHFFTPQDMMLHHGKGLPMVWHFGIMWGDIVIALWCGIVVANYGYQWSGREILYVGLAALVLSAVMHYQYLQDHIPNSHMHHGRLTAPAYVHFWFMLAALTIIGLFFLCTTDLPVWIVVGSSVLLWIHVVLGTHLVVKLWSPAWFSPQPPADVITLVVWAGAGFGLTALSWLSLR